MKNIAAAGVLERIRRLAPQASVPPYRTVEEWREWQLVEGRKRSEEINRQNHQLRVEKILNRSGPASAQQMLVCELSGAERRAKIRAEPGQIHS
ncbi:hypothetical protein OkiPb00031_47660 [Escherichia coli]